MSTKKKIWFTSPKASLFIIKFRPLSSLTVGDGRTTATLLTERDGEDVKELVFALVTNLDKKSLSLATSIGYWLTGSSASMQSLISKGQQPTPIETLIWNTKNSLLVIHCQTPVCEYPLLTNKMLNNLGPETNFSSQQLSNFHRRHFLDIG